MIGLPFLLLRNCMRIFNGFLIIFASVVLFMLPISRGVYDFRTDVREDLFNYETGGGVTTANVVLHTPIYNDDINTIVLYSDLATDVPLFSAYNTTTRLLDITGLTVASNRTLRVNYDINALVDNVALSTFMDWLPFIWFIVIAVLPMVALYVIIKYRRS